MGSLTKDRLLKAMNSVERFIYGPDSFLPHRRATGALVTYCDQHGISLECVNDLRDCLLRLDAGERSMAVEAFKRIRTGKDGLGDWFPPVVLPGETPEYALAVFEALVERWQRLMSSLAKGGPETS